MLTSLISADRSIVGQDSGMSCLSPAVAAQSKLSMISHAVVCHCVDSMGINETIADTRHWITEHKLKAIGQILDSLLSVARGKLNV